MIEPWTQFWLTSMSFITFATIIQCHDNEENHLTNNQKYVMWAICLFLVHSEYRIADVKQAFLDADPSAYHRWEEIQRGPDTD